MTHFYEVVVCKDFDENMNPIGIISKYYTKTKKDGIELYDFLKNHVEGDCYVLMYKQSFLILEKLLYEFRLLMQHNDLNSDIAN